MTIELLYLILGAIYFYLPAYFANGMPIVFGGGTPLDFEKNWSDGRRIFGEGKTFQGAVFGILVGTLAIGLIQGNLKLALFLSVGAILGDLAKSFIKRRLGHKSGEKFFPWDQIDFLIGATAMSFLVGPLNFEYVVVIFIVTPVVHLLANYGAYTLKLKKVPY